MVNTGNLPVFSVTKHSLLTDTELGLDSTSANASTMHFISCGQRHTKRMVILLRCCYHTNESKYILIIQPLIQKKLLDEPSLCIRCRANPTPLMILHSFRSKPLPASSFSVTHPSSTVFNSFPHCPC